MNDRDLEMIAMGFLKDLVDRNLIMIDMLGSTGNIKACKIHDLLRDLCLNEVEKNGLYRVIGRSQGINKECRRVVIPRRKTSLEKVYKELKCMPHARSIICDNGIVPACWKFRLLRTFHAYKFRGLEDKSYKNPLAFQLVKFRHLAVEVDTTFSFFSSLNLFWNLHTLIVSGPYYHNYSTGPSEIWRMPQFRHIEFLQAAVCHPDPPTDMDEDAVVMENLRILKGVKNLKCSEEVVKRIPNIKKLKIQYDYELDDNYCVSNIKSLSKLESLDVSGHGKFSFHLQKLRFPGSLKSLSVAMGDEFEWEEMVEKIDSLPCLEKLRLRNGCFGAGKWEIVEGQFPELRYLELLGCRGWKQWTVEGSSVLPRLEQLELHIVEELEEIPCEIGEIPSLQKIRMVGCSESAVRSAKVIVEEQLELQGEPLPFHIEVRLVGKNEAVQR